MTSTALPPVPRWWLSINESPAGPFDEAQIIAYMNAGRVPAAALICLEGSQQWQPLTSWPAFAGIRQPELVSCPTATISAFPAANHSQPVSQFGSDDPRIRYQRRKQNQQFWWWLIGIAVPMLLALRVVLRLLQ
jgi:hypothetical protein